jgi:hypothetical protein
VSGTARWARRLVMVAVLRRVFDHVFRGAP